MNIIIAFLSIFFIVLLSLIVLLKYRHNTKIFITWFLFCCIIITYFAYEYAKLLYSQKIDLNICKTYIVDITTIATGFIVLFILSPLILSRMIKKELSQKAQKFFIILRIIIFFLIMFQIIMLFLISILKSHRQKLT